MSWLVHLSAPCFSLHAGAGIQSKARKKKHWGGVGKPHPIFPNILARQFYSQMPLQKVVTDITEFYWHGRKCFFTCYLDLFNNEMFSWNLGFREDLPFILKPLKEFLQIRRKASVQKTIIYTDQGSQYCSPAFTTLLKRNGIIQSMSRAGTPHDNSYPPAQPEFLHMRAKPCFTGCASRRSELSYACNDTSHPLPPPAHKTKRKSKAFWCGRGPTGGGCAPSLPKPLSFHGSCLFLL